MASSTYWEIFQDIIDLTSLANTYADSTPTTRLIKKAIQKAEKRAQTNTMWYNTETTSTFSTTANVNSYVIPTGADQVKKMYLTNGTRRWYLWPDRLLNGIEFDKLQRVQTIRSDIPQYWSIQANQVLIFPTPSSGGYTMTVFQNNIATWINPSPSISTDQNTVCSIKEWYEDMLTFKWCSVVFRQREQWDLVAQYDKEYDKIFAEYWNKVANATQSPLIKSWKSWYVNPTLYPNTLIHN
jgi:hypothetical protein